MAVAAADIALLDLGPQHRECAGVDEAAYLGELRFRVAVIELENDRVSLAAVHAWMRGQVRGDEFAVARSIDGPLSVSAGPVRGGIPPVVLPAVFAAARLAIGTTRTA